MVNGSSIHTVGRGSYSQINKLTLADALFVPSVDIPIFGVSSLTHLHKMIVILSDPISHIIPDTQLNKKSLDNLMSVAQAQAPPTRVHFDPIDNLFKLPVLSPLSGGFTHYYL